MAITLQDGLLTTIKLSGSSVVGNVLNIDVRDTVTQGGAATKSAVCFNMTGASGLTPQIRVLTTGTWLGNVPTTAERGFFSYDSGATWTEMGNAPTTGAGYLEYTHTSAFSQSTVMWSRWRREGHLVTRNWIDALDAAHPTFLHNVPGGSNYTIGVTFSNQTDELGATIPGQDLFMFTISDASASGLGTKRPCLITAGVHAAEDWSQTIMRYLVDWWCGASSEAFYLRRRFNPLVIPYCNPMGREGGHSRGQFQTVGVANDMNRNMNVTPTVLEVCDYSKSYMDSLLQASGVTAFSIDLHTTNNAGFTTAAFGGGGGFSPMNNSFLTRGVARISSLVSLGNTVPADYLNGYMDAYCGTTFSCVMAETFEVNTANRQPLSDAQSYGEGIGLTIYDMAINGDFGAATGSDATSSPFARRSS